MSCIFFSLWMSSPLKTLHSPGKCRVVYNLGSMLGCEFTI
jgi:hypothetical protein